MTTKELKTIKYTEIKDKHRDQAKEFILAELEQRKPCMVIKRKLQAIAANVRARLLYYRFTLFLIGKQIFATSASNF